MQELLREEQGRAPLRRGPRRQDTPRRRADINHRPLRPE
jgi:hypothetical protein